MNEQFPTQAPTAEQPPYIKKLINKLGKFRECEETARAEGRSWVKHASMCMQQINPFFYDSTLKKIIGEHKFNTLKNVSDQISQELATIRSEYEKASTDQVPEEVREKIYSKVDEINQLFA